MFVVFDLDDTLTDTRHRAHLPPDWRSFYDQCINDIPLWSTVCIFQDLVEHHRVEIWTGRCESVRKLTEEWLQKYVGTVPVLRMRPEDYKGPNYVLKQKWLDSCRRKPDLVFEDRSDIAQMYRESGVRVCLVDSPSASAAEKVDAHFKKTQSSGSL